MGVPVRIFDTIRGIWTELRGDSGAAHVKDGIRVPLGYEKITSLNTAKAFTVPAGATLALIRAETQDIRWRDDGSNPTSTEGMLLKTTDGPFPYTGSLSAFRAIETTASATLFVSYYR